MPNYRATQKTVKCLELVVKYLDSATSRLTDDSGMQSSKDVVAFCRDILQAAADMENATRIVTPEATPAAPVVTPEVASASDASDAAEIERQQAEILARVEAELAAAESE